MPGTVADGFGRAVDDLRMSVESATRVARLIGDHWWDTAGQAVAERVERIAGELGRAADAIALLARILAEALARQGRPAEPSPTGPPGTGPLLPGLDGQRVDERRGVTLPSLGT